MTTIICILLLVVLAIIIARCNGSSKLGRDLLVSIALGVAVSFGVKMYNAVHSDDTSVAKIENVNATAQLPTQFLCTPVEIQGILNVPGTVSKVLSYNAFTTLKERLRLVNNPLIQMDVGTPIWDSS